MTITQLPSSPSSDWQDVDKLVDYLLHNCSAPTTPS